MSILTMPESSSYQQEFRYVDSYPRSLSSLSSRNSSSPIPTTKQDWQYQAPVPSKLPVSSLTMDIHSYAAYWSDESPKPSSVNGSSIDGAQYMPSSDDVNWITRPHPQEDLAMLDNDSLRSHPGASAALQMDPSFLDHMHSSLPATTSTATSSPGHTSYNPILASASSSSTTDTTVLSSKSVSASSLQASHPPSSLDMEFLPSNPHESYHSVYSVLPDQKGLQDMNPSFDMQVMPTYQGTETGPRENSQVSMAPASAVDSYAQDPPHQLQLTDLGSIHEQHQQQLLQSWVGVTMGRSPMDSPHHSPGSIHPTFSSSPGFFMPTFLDSLQEAESSTTLVKSSHSSLQGDDYGFQLSEPSTEGANTDHHRDTTMRSLGWQSQHPQQQQEQQQQDSSALLPLQQPTHSFTEQKQQLQLSSHECAAAAAQHQFQTSSYGLSSNHLETGHPAGGHLQNGHFGSSPPTSPTPNQSSSSSTNSSPPVTPMYGRLSNLSLRSGTPTPAPSIPFGNNGASMHTGFSGSRAGSLLNYSSPMPEGFEEQLRSSRRDPNDPHALMMIRKQQQVDVGTARLMQRAAHEVRLKHLLQNYLQAADPVAVGERTVVILTSKVAQKSYGTEKRFLCPPPTAILIGTSWWTARKGLGDELEDLSNTFTVDDGMGLAPPKLTVCISGESSSQAGQIEWYTVSGATVGQTGHTKTPQQQQQQHQHQAESHHPSRFRSSESRNNSVDWYHNHQQETLAAGKCVSKHLYINDADEKRKRVECLVRIQLANGLTLGTLASKGIKVISKPSKKRQSVKNMELCIHHGTTVSLFNRIRSQTVSTKYLGVSSNKNSPFSFPGHPGKPLTRDTSGGDGTCFVARTASWDPFVVWVVDITRTPGDGQESDVPEDYIGHNTPYTRTVPYPPPPAIALKNTTNQLIPIHYNQHIVLQCLTTGLVSPVMIIRKVDKASTVVGGARNLDDPPLTGGGGEYGDEVLGDPVSQLHKIALQIVQDPAQAASTMASMDTEPDNPPFNMMPRSTQPVTYLACLNDMVGMHRTAEARQPIQPHRPQTPTNGCPPSYAMSAWEDYMSSAGTMMDTSGMVSAGGGKVVRKRRVSTDILEARPHRNNSPLLRPGKLVSSMSLNNLQELGQFSQANWMADPIRRRVNSLTEAYDPLYGPTSGSNASMGFNRGRSDSISMAERKMSLSASSSTSTSSSRRMSVSSVGGGSSSNSGLGAYWNEDVSDAAVWTIVGTDCATFTFWTPPGADEVSLNNGYAPMSSTAGPLTPPISGSSSSAPAPFPIVLHYTMTSNSYKSMNNQNFYTYNETSGTTARTDLLSLHGENFTRDLQVWFGDIKSPQTEYRSRELFICRVPSHQDLYQCAGLEQERDGKYKVPILLVRGDGIVYKTNKYLYL